jgi:hypothetical protein
MIVRGLQGIKEFNNKNKLCNFLGSLGDDSEANGYVLSSLQVAKVKHVVKNIRQFYADKYRITRAEYYGAALLKTLEVLSYGKLASDSNARATTFVDYLISEIQSVTK